MAKLTQEELAELQDPDTWEDGGIVRPAVKSPRAIVSVAFSREDFDNVAAYAERHGMKTSEFIRRAALERTSPNERGTVVSATGGVQTSYAAISLPRTTIEVKTPLRKESAVT